LLEALQPPEGYRLGSAIATTYTLDLLALLTAPLAFTFFDWEDGDGRPSANPLALLEAIRRHARKIHVFCHGGAIHVPRDGQVLLAHLEPCVVEVGAPRGGVFHPKVWVLRFDPDHESSEPVRFRLLVGTRNLTFDRSWDTLLQLEGKLVAGAASREHNRPLAEFITALPGLALHEPPTQSLQATEALADQVLHVEWELPSGVKEIEFLPFGIGERPWPFDLGRQRLVMAPFLDAAFLDRFGGGRKDGIVVSWPESLQGAQEGLTGYAEPFVLADGVEDEDAPESEGETAGEREGGGEQDEGRGADSLSGLHAKLFVLDDGFRAHVFTGSANGTQAAFERNVEFLVRLDGSKKAMGVEALLGREESGKLSELLEPWRPAELEEDPDREVLERLERVAEEVRRALVDAELWLELCLFEPPQRSAKDPSHESEPGRGGGDEAYLLELHGLRPSIPAGVRLTCWPVVLPPLAAIELVEAQPLARFEVSLGAATGFVAFEVVAREGALEHRLRFARRLPLRGLPPDREERLLRSLLKDRETVLRLLHLLLSADEISAESLTGFVTGEGTGGWRANELGFPLFEPLVRALAAGGDALEPVERLVADLSRTEEGRELLPEGFEGLWDTVRAAREELAR